MTIATNMAGRGTDITLGEGSLNWAACTSLVRNGTNPAVSTTSCGPLRPSGGPGSTRFYLSLEDDLMRLFGSDNISGIMDKLGMEEDEPIEHKLVTRSIENAQKKVESRNFDIRKHVLEYDDVMNQQREVIYDQRRKILERADLKDDVLNMASHIVDPDAKHVRSS